MITEDKNKNSNWEGVSNLSNLRVPKGKGKEVVWNSILEGIDDQKVTRTAPMWSVALKVAAAFIGLLLLGSLTWITIFGSTTIYSPAGKHLMVNLPDGSTVKLNSETRMSYNSYYWYFSRIVELDGEALFTVKKGNTFSVKTGVVITQVLGTTFNVYARNNEVKVSCIEGKVAVVHSVTKQKVLLTPSQKTSLSEGELKDPVEVAKTEMATWTNGEFYYMNERLEDVFKELERQFNVKIVLKTSPGRLYSGVFFKRDLRESLDLICIPMRLKWEITNKTIVISEAYNN